jgi:adhesin transport system outer membrane protein
MIYNKKCSKAVVTFMTLLMLSACNTSDFSFKHAVEKSVKNIGTSFKAVSSPGEQISLDDGLSTAPPEFLLFSTKNAAENVRRAVMAHPSVLKALSKSNAATSSVGIAKSLEKTQSTVSLSGGFVRDNGTTDPGALAQLSLSRLIYDFGATESTIKSAELQSEAAHAELQLAAEEIAIKAYSAWTILGSTREILNVYQKGLNLAEPLLGQIKNISTSGLSDKAMALAAQQKYASLELGFDEVRSNLLRAEIEFMELFPGVDIQSVGTLAYSNQKTVDPDILEAQMLEQSNFLKALYHMAEAKEFEIKSAHSELKPTISVSGSATLPGEALTEDSVANLGLLVNYSLNDGGRRLARLEALKQDLAGLNSDINQTKILGKKQLKLLLQKKSANEKRETSLQLMLDLAKEVQDTSKRQLVSGRSKIEDVMSAEVVLAQTQIDLITTQTDLQMGAIQLDGLVNGLLDVVNTKN